MKWILSLLFVFGLGTAQGESLAKVKVGATPAMSTAGLYLGMEKGYFAKEGIEIDLVQSGNSGAAFTLLLAKGELDVGAGGFTSGLFNAINEGNSIRVVADKGHVSKGNEYIALVVRKDHSTSGRYKDLKDLKGMKVALPSLDGVSQQVVMDAILGKAKLNEKDITYVKLSYPEIGLAFKAKEIDASVQLEPFLSKSILDGDVVQVMSSQEALPNQQSAAMFFSPKFAKDRKDEGIRFMRAYLRGVKLYNQALKDPKLWAEIVPMLSKHVKVDDPRVWEKMHSVGLRDNGRIDQAGLKADLQWYKAKGFVKKMPDIGKLVDHSFVDKAFADLKSEDTAKK